MSERASWSHRARNVAAVAVVAIGVVAFGRSGAGGPPPTDQTDESSSISEHWQVVAQGIVDLGAGPHQWTALPIAVGPSPVTITASSFTFMVAGGEVPVSLGSPDGYRARLGTGEAVFRTAGAVTTATSASAASLTSLTLEPVEVGAAGQLLTPGPGSVDLDLVRDVLAPAETLALPTIQPAFVVVSAGTVDANGITLRANAGATISGELVVANTGDEPAVVLVALTSGPIDAAVVDAPAGDTPSAGDADLGGRSDSDGDSLADEDETSLYNTDPLDADTDDDTIGDYREVFVLGTDPKNADTDGDGLGDEEEATYGTSPTDNDSDNDTYPDGVEVSEFGTDPLDQSDFPGNVPVTVPAPEETFPFPSVVIPTTTIP